MVEPKNPFDSIAAAEQHQMDGSTRDSSIGSVSIACSRVAGNKGSAAVAEGDSNGVNNDSNEDDDDNVTQYSQFSHFSNYSQEGDHSLPNPEEHYRATSTRRISRNNTNPSSSSINNNATTTTDSNTTPRQSNISGFFMRSNTTPMALAGATHVDNVDNPSVLGTDNSTTHTRGKYLIIRITTRPINSWSPKLIHADGTSKTLTVDLPDELACSTGSGNHYVITQQGWQDLFHIIATAVAKNTSESILIFWISSALLIIMALVLLLGLVHSLVFRLRVFLSVLGFCLAMGITHTIIRRIRVQRAVTKVVEECFYDDENDEEQRSSSIDNNGGIISSLEAIDIASEEFKNKKKNDDNNNKIDTTNELVEMGGLDGLQDLEDSRRANNSDENPQDDAHSSSLSQRKPSHSNNNRTNTVGNRQRSDTNCSEASSSKDSNMIFEDGCKYKATSRDGRYTVDWKWEYFGLDAVVRISWE